VKLLIIILNAEEHFETILSILTELDAPNATIIESEKLEQFLANKVPIFAGLREIMGETRSVCKTILTFIDEKEFLPKFKKLLAEEKIDFNSSDTGIMLTIAADKV